MPPPQTRPRPFEALEQMASAGTLTITLVRGVYAVELQAGDVRFVGQSTQLPNAIRQCDARWQNGQDATLPPCRSGKRPYRQDEAETAAADTVATNLRRGSAKTACRAYQCPICTNWHVTSQPIRAPFSASQRDDPQ